MDGGGWLRAPNQPGGSAAALFLGVPTGLPARHSGKKRRRGGRLKVPGSGGARWLENSLRRLGRTDGWVASKHQRAPTNGSTRRFQLSSGPGRAKTTKLYVQGHRDGFASISFSFLTAGTWNYLFESKRLLRLAKMHAISWTTQQNSSAL